MKHGTRLSDSLEIRLPGSEEILEFRRIPAGSFRMGQRGAFPEEEPVHRVTIPDDFYFGVYPVTQAQFEVWTATKVYEEWFEAHAEKIRETSPAKVAVRHRNYFGEPARPRHPADSVTWWEARGYAEWLNGLGLLPPGWVAELPSEAQWEYACRGRTETAYWSGDGEEDLKRVGWYGGNAGGTTHAVGEKGKEAANAYGLFDLHGNVWEWCLDYYDPRVYGRRVEGGPGAPLLDEREVERGEADPDGVAWAPLMRRFAGDDEAGFIVQATDRPSLTRLGAYAKVRVDNGDGTWKPVAEHVKEALLRGRWPVKAEAKDVARQLRDIFQGWVDQAASLSSPPRVLRGGAWNNTAAGCRSAIRDRRAPGSRNSDCGFRLSVLPGPASQNQPAAGAERADGGEARRQAAAEPESGRGAEAAGKRGNRARAGGRGAAASVVGILST